MGQHKDKLNAPRKSLSSRLFDQLASVKFAVAVVVIIAAACVAGTLRPKADIFAAWWFISLLCLLSASVAVCSTRRFATVRRTTGYARGRALGSMITHISILTILAGGVIRGVWGQKGYLEFREGQTVAQYTADRGAKPLPFAIQLTKFEIETYDQSSPAGDDGNTLLVAWPEKQLQATLPIKLGVEQAFDEFKITILKYIPDFVVDTETREVMSRSREPRNPAILVAVTGPTYRNHRWLFAKFPEFTMHTKDDPATGPSPLQMAYQNHGATAAQPMSAGPIKSFKSTVVLMDGDRAVGERTIEVNRPLKFKGFTLYQSGYNPNDLSYTSLQVVNDPGVPVVYAGFGLMILGLFIVFYLNPWMESRKKAA